MKFIGREFTDVKGLLAGGYVQRTTGASLVVLCSLFRVPGSVEPQQNSRIRAYRSANCNPLYSEGSETPDAFPVIPQWESTILYN